MVDDGAVRATLAKSRRLVLVSRNLARLLARRVGAPDHSTSRSIESIRVQVGQTPTMQPVIRRD
jgi:hypothetical protein